MLVLTLFALMAPYEILAKNDLKSCFSNLEKYEMKPMQISYNQIVGSYFGQAYCRVTIDEEHPYSCVQLAFHPMKNPLYGKFTLSILPKGENKTTEFEFKVYPTLLPGVFILAKNTPTPFQNDLREGRVMVVLEKTFDVFVYYLCSTHDQSPSAHYNDFRINTVVRDVHPGQMLRDLRRYHMATTCNNFIIPQFNCF